VHVHLENSMRAFVVTWTEMGIVIAKAIVRTPRYLKVKHAILPIFLRPVQIHVPIEICLTPLKEK
jgi:hypothetical protein